jgi:hypothetical protein
MAPVGLEQMLLHGCSVQLRGLAPGYCVQAILQIVEGDVSLPSSFVPWLSFWIASCLCLVSCVVVGIYVQVVDGVSV